MADPAWPDDWADRVAGDGCPMCSSLGRGDNDFSVEVFTGDVAEVRLERRSRLPGYCVVIWRLGHVAEPDDLDPGQASRYWAEVVAAGRAVRERFSPVKMNYMTLGNTVPHLHTHVVPRYPGDPAPGGRPGGLRLDFNKALSGAAASALARDRATAINPAVFDAAALVICASWEECVFPGVPGREPDAALAESGQRFVGEVMDIIRAAAPDAGSYVNETDYHQPDWQRSFWGGNYARLLEIKRAYDPGNLFRVHHGVGSEATGG